MILAEKFKFIVKMGI